MHKNATFASIHLSFSIIIGFYFMRVFSVWNSSLDFCVFAFWTNGFKGTTKIAVCRNKNQCSKWNPLDLFAWFDFCIFDSMVKLHRTLALERHTVKSQINFYDKITTRKCYRVKYGIKCTYTNTSQLENVPFIVNSSRPIWMHAFLLALPLDTDSAM